MKRIGYWRNDQHPEYPDPYDFVFDSVADERTEQLLNALDLGSRVRFYMGMSPCRVCGAPNGSAEVTDGEHMWPEGLAHYVRDHNVSLPRAVVDSVIRRFETLEMADADDSWWIAQAADPVAAHPAWPMLYEIDDPNHLERPQRFDSDNEVQRAHRLISALSTSFNWKLTIDAGTGAVQDASFLGDISIPPQATCSGHRIVIRLSNFGHLAVVAAEGFGVHDQAQMAMLIDDQDRHAVARALGDGGYRIVPEDLMWRPYDGRSDSLRAAYATSIPSWWIRYFDYI
jgi:hypothetical protein